MGNAVSGVEDGAAGAGDPFTDLLASLSGAVVHFQPGSGGLEDALSSLSFLTLCGHHDLAVAVDGGPLVGTSWRFFGSAQDAARASGPRRALLPLAVPRLDVLEILARQDVSLFFSDPRWLRAAELQGVPREACRLTRDPVSGIDLSPFSVPSTTGVGTLRFSTDGMIPGDGDGASLHLSGPGARWRSVERCRAAVQQAIALVAPYAEVVTTSPALAALVVRLGRRAILREADGAVGERPPRMALEPVVPSRAGTTALPGPDELGPGEGDARAGDPGSDQRLKDAWRALHRLRHERDALALEVDTLREKLDAGIAAAVMSDERDARGVRLVPARLLEELSEEAERREQASRASYGELERSIRERDVEHANRVAVLDAERMAAEQQLASVRDALDATASDRSAARERLDAVLSSTSWTLTRPLRATVRALRRLRGRRARDV